MLILVANNCSKSLTVDEDPKTLSLEFEEIFLLQNFGHFGQNIVKINYISICLQSKAWLQENCSILWKQHNLLAEWMLMIFIDVVVSV